MASRFGATLVCNANGDDAASGTKLSHNEVARLKSCPSWQGRSSTTPTRGLDKYVLVSLRALRVAGTHQLQCWRETKVVALPGCRESKAVLSELRQLTFRLEP